MGWGPLNLLATIGALIIALSVVVFLANVIRTLRASAHAGANPWNGTTLEWATPSPPPPYGFAAIPVVDSREPLHQENRPLRASMGCPSGSERCW